jgi:hypothetical protein
VPGVAFYNLGKEAADEGRYLASIVWNTAGHLEYLATGATGGIGGVFVGTLRAGARFAARGSGKLLRYDGPKPAYVVNPTHVPVDVCDQARHRKQMIPRTCLIMPLQTIPRTRQRGLEGVAMGGFTATQ